MKGTTIIMKPLLLILLTICVSSYAQPVKDTIDGLFCASFFDTIPPTPAGGKATIKLSTYYPVDSRFERKVLTYKYRIRFDPNVVDTTAIDSTCFPLFHLWRFQQYV